LDSERRLQRRLLHLRIVDLQEERKILTGFVDAAHKWLHLVAPYDELPGRNHASIVERLDRSGQNDGARGKLFLLIAPHLERVMKYSRLAARDVARDNINLVTAWLQS